jgi:Ca2+/H+ antiporter, TMEM165/GDT1 family
MVHASPPRWTAVEAFLVSTLVVAVGEIGDKTQLLALFLSARFRRPLPILIGILVATLANHALAGALGEWVRSAISPQGLRWAVGVSFIAIGVWALRPDRFDGMRSAMGSYGVFLVTASAFFLAEMGDKTQIATVALAAKFDAFIPVVAGTTLGLMIANAPVVLIAYQAAPRIPLKAVRIVAAALFIGLGIAVLVQPGAG